MTSPFIDPSTCSSRAYLSRVHPVGALIRSPSLLGSPFRYRMSHVDAATQTEDDDPTTLRLLKRIDALLDRLLCKCCEYENNRLPLSALKTWKPDSNVCSDCKYLFDAADDPDPDVTGIWSRRGLPTKYYWSSASSSEDEDDNETPVR